MDFYRQLPYEKVNKVNTDIVEKFQNKIDRISDRTGIGMIKYFSLNTIRTLSLLWGEYIIMLPQMVGPNSILSFFRIPWLV